MSEIKQRRFYQVSNKAAQLENRDLPKGRFSQNETDLNTRDTFTEKEDVRLETSITNGLSKERQSEAINEEDSSRRRVLKGIATLYNSGLQIMATINIQSDNQKTNARAQEFFQIWKRGKITISSVLAEYGKLVEELKVRVRTYIEEGKECEDDLKKVCSKLEKINQLSSSKKEVSWREVEGTLSLSSVRHFNITEQYQEIHDLTEVIQAQNLAISHILLNEGVYNHENKTLTNTPEALETAIETIQQNKIKVNPNFGDNSAPILSSVVLSKDQVQARYPVGFLEYQSDFEETQNLFKAKERREKLHAHYDERGGSGDVSLLSEQRLRNEVSGVVKKLDKMAVVQFLDSELAGVQGDTPKERVLMKLALLQKTGQQIKDAGISSSSLGIQDMAQTKLAELADPQSGLTIKVMLEEHSQVVKDYKERVEAYAIGCQKYVNDLHNANEKLPKILEDNDKTQWDEAEKGLNSLGVMSIFFHDESLVTQCEKIRDLEKKREVLNLTLSHVLTYGEVYSGSAQNAEQNKREIVDTPEVRNAVVSKIQTERMKDTHNLQGKFLPPPTGGFDTLPQDFKNDQKTFTDVQAVFKGKENPEKLQRKYGGNYQGEVRRYSELYILDKLIGELENFSKIQDDQLANEVNTVPPNRSEVKKGTRLSTKGVVELLNSVFSIIVIMLSSVLPKKQTVRGTVGLGRRRSYDVRSEHNVGLPRYASAPDPGLADYDVAEKQVSSRDSYNIVGFSDDSSKGLKLVRSKPMSDLLSQTEPDIADKKEEGLTHAITSDTRDSQVNNDNPTLPSKEGLTGAITSSGTEMRDTQVNDDDDQTLTLKEPKSLVSGPLTESIENNKVRNVRNIG